MKVLNLRCARLHGFEGWFANEDAFQTQLTQGLLSCPVCNDADIVKLPSAPRLNLSGQAEPQGSPNPESAGIPGQLARPGAGLMASDRETVALSPEMQGVMLAVVRELIARTTDVGDQFVAQAREMHHGDREPAPIRGRASVDQTLELLEEGISVLPLPDLPGLKETLQ